ncbi:Transcription factor IIIA [Nibea albiflora]|uniref:Transcription factor IIIA n=1 Tax=Nibea albiflora TaxID=240163 RepID=A0ACB7F5C3_NIBAL|nr:Transcription factor IIIA [Nibea albiflora]
MSPVNLRNPFSCQNCDKSFCTRYQLTRHELNHSGEKPHKCLADGCSEAFVKNSSMKNHMARVHQQKEKPYRCTKILKFCLCDHQGCGKDFHKRNQLKAHTFEHLQLLPFHCSFSGCTREFPTHGKLKHHERMHAGYPCENEGCLFHGKTWTEYLKHRKEHKGMNGLLGDISAALWSCVLFSSPFSDKVPCGECKKLFNNHWFLHQHEMRVHSGREKRKLPCPRKGCARQFTRRFNLESHVLGDHEGKKPFSCAYAGCGKSFAMKKVRLAAAANQAETNKLAEKLRKTTLKENKS